MKNLLIVETDRVSLRLSKSQLAVNGLYGNSESQTDAYMEIKPLRAGLVFSKVWRNIPGELANSIGFTGGPRLYEQTSYKLYLQSNCTESVKITHRDPILLKDLDNVNDGQIIYGSINFHSQVGFSEFTVWVGTKPEFTFIVEVYPSKLDYKSDYDKIVADVQDILTELAMEYLRSTYQWGSNIKGKRSGTLEWIVLLKNIIDELDKSMHYIAKRPVRSLHRQNNMQRVEKIKKIDSCVRGTIRHGAGKGDFVSLNNGLPVKQVITENFAQTTLDTMEHRWLAGQLRAILRQLSRMYSKEATIWNQDTQNQTIRRKQVMDEMKQFEARIAALTKLEPLAAAHGEAPNGFASLQLLGTPGYKEAYKACLVLSLGLRIEGGPFNLSVKDLNLLYEYWCYLALLRIVSEETGQSIETENIFSIQNHGIKVLLQKGKQQQVTFNSNQGRKINIAYNPKFQDKDVLIAQKPDMLISILDNNWPTIHMVLDAKYRLDRSPKYKEHYYTAGPPEDAINTMHRYRDAIIERENNVDGLVPRRTVIEAAAIFPLQYDAQNSFKQSKLWKALSTIGVGAIPFLPDNTGYVQEWVRGVLNQGGFSTSRRAIAYNIHERAHDWKQKAAQSVLVATLRGDNPDEHWQWINEESLYYMPYYKTQRRQAIVQDIVFYLPQPLRSPGAVAYHAKIVGYEIRKRIKIDTPWIPRRDITEEQVLYQLSDLKMLPNPIENKKGHSFTSHRWTTLLSLERALSVEELSLETEPEWRLWEDLNAMGYGFKVIPGNVRLIDKHDPVGRNIFRLDNGWQIRYMGSSGFSVNNKAQVQANFSYRNLMELITESYQK